jgi:acetyltransferase-like isoleucine patch superfamily enzyme
MTHTQISSVAAISPDLVVKGTGTLIIQDFASIEERVIIDTGVDGYVSIGKRAKLKTGTVVRAHSGALTLGDRCTLGEYSLVACHGGVDIGPLCMFGPYVLINAAAHLIDGPEPYRFLGERTQGIIIESGVWVGARVTILDGARVGQRAIIGAHSLVTTDIPAEMLAVGTPARLIRRLRGREHHGSLSKR